MVRRLRLALCIWLLVLVLVPIQVFGHTKLLETDPLQGSQVELSPDHLQLQFSEKLEGVSEQSLLVEDEAGKRIETGPVQTSEDNKSIQLTLPELTKGTYTVRYHVMSLDGHMVMGDYSFTVLNDREQVVDPVETVEPDVPEVPTETHHHKPDELPTDNSADYGVAPTDIEEGTQVSWTSVFTEVEVADVLRMIYFAIFLFLVGMLIWYIVLQREKTDSNALVLRDWIVQLQRAHLLVLIAVVVEFVQHSVGFDDWQQVSNILLHTTAGFAWSALLLLSLIGLLVLQRNKLLDVVWILASAALLSQIGHSAASEYRIIASILIAFHLLAAALWAGGLLYLILLWRRHRDIAEKLVITFSNASLIAMTVLVLGGIVSSLLYVSDISYVFETRWGYTLLIKIAAVVLVLITGMIIRRGFIRKGQLHVGTWIKLDFVLLVVIVSLAALLTAAEPNPPNEPLHWHEMGQTIHMTTEITPRVPGDNRFSLRVWLPEDSGQPKEVSMQISRESDEQKKTISLLEVEGANNDYGFGGFTEYTFQANSSQLNQAGTWSVDIEIIDQQGQAFTYKKQIRVY